MKGIVLAGGSIGQCFAAVRQSVSVCQRLRVIRYGDGYTAYAAGDYQPDV